MFLGGNFDKTCHLYDTASDTWTPRGALPIFHLVTQQITMNYQDQILTVFANVDFEKNSFKINSAANYGSKKDKLTAEWFYAHNDVTDIDNFCIKTATIYQDKMIAFCRGKPREVLE